MTVRFRCSSWMVAWRNSLPPSSFSSTNLVSTSGWRRSRSNANPGSTRWSHVPHPNRVNNSSETSWRDIGCRPRRCCAAAARGCRCAPRAEGRLALVDQIENRAIEVAAELRELAPTGCAGRCRTAAPAVWPSEIPASPTADDLAQVVEVPRRRRRTRSQDDVQRDPVHRLERGELGASGQAAVSRSVLFDDLLVVLDALAVERRGEPACDAPGAPCRPKRKTEPGPRFCWRLGARSSGRGAREEHLPRQAGSETTTLAGRRRNVDREDGAVRFSAYWQERAAKGRHQNHLNGPSAGARPAASCRESSEASYRRSMLCQFIGESLQRFPWYYMYRRFV